MRTELPSLILTKASFDERYDEEYYRRLDVVDGAERDLTAVFRSQCRLNDDAFNNVLFLIATIS